MTIGVLKRNIKKLYPSLGEGSLKAWEVNLPRSESLGEDAIQATHGTPLKSTRRLPLLFPNEPADDTIHIVVKNMNSVGKWSILIRTTLSLICFALHILSLPFYPGPFHYINNITEQLLLIWMKAIKTLPPVKAH
jgi:hypothetical protein